MITYEEITLAESDKRLLKLAELLEHIKATRKQLTRKVNVFDMSSYYAKRSCGTAACAGGYAALHPWFRKRGLKLLFYFYMDGLRDHEIVYQGHSAFSALSAFFGISDADTQVMFGVHEVRTARQEAKVIRQFVADRAKAARAA